MVVDSEQQGEPQVAASAGQSAHLCPLSTLEACIVAQLPLVAADCSAILDQAAWHVLGSAAAALGDDLERASEPAHWQG